MAYLQVAPLGDSRDETWRGQGIRERSVLEFAKTVNCDSATEVSNQVTHRTTYSQNNSWVVQEIPSDWLPVHCEMNNPAGAIARDCRASAAGILPRKEVWAECARHLTEASTIPGSRDFWGLLTKVSHTRIGGSVWYLVLNHHCTFTVDSVLANSKTQNAFLYPVLAKFLHDCPLAVKPTSMPWRLLSKKPWRDSPPIDMVFSVVSFLVVALPSSEILEGRMNYSVLYC
jgi:hypothetical protein